MKTLARSLATALLFPMLTAWAPMAPAMEPAALLPVPLLDLSRYQGHWYQVAFVPNRFLRDCQSDTTADYTLLDHNRVRVVNRCRTAAGATLVAEGLARPQREWVMGIPAGEPLGPARFEVRFAPEWLSWVPWVWASYWVIQLADDYRYAVIGEPQREYLWILSRTPTLAPEDMANIRRRLREQGYDPDKLVDTPAALPASSPASS